MKYQEHGMSGKGGSLAPHSFTDDGDMVVILTVCSSYKDLDTSVQALYVLTEKTVSFLAASTGIPEHLIRAKYIKWSALLATAQQLEKKTREEFRVSDGEDFPF